MPTENFRHELLSNVHCSWIELLSRSLDRMDPEFLNRLECDSDWLPGADRCFRAFFRVPRSEVRVVWLGQSPYTSSDSASGLSFYDAQVQDLFRSNGVRNQIGTLSTMQPSVRNILKAWFVAIGRRTVDNTKQEYISSMEREGLISNLSELFDRGQTYGWLWLNATLSIWPESVEQPLSKRIQICKWLPLVEAVLRDVLERDARVVLLGEIAEEFAYIANDPLIAPHPAARTNDFIHHTEIRDFLRQWRCLIEVNEQPPSR